MKPKLWLIAAFGAVLVLLAAATLFWPSARPAGTGGDFTLDSADGPVALSALRGKTVLLYFGYTYCPDICPTTLTSHAAALALLKPEERARVVPLFVSVDPERDTPARLKEYAQFFHPQMIGLTAPPARLQAVARQYGVFYARQAANESGQYAVDHTSESYLIAPDGHLAERLPHGASPETIVAALRRWTP